MEIIEDKVTKVNKSELGFQIASNVGNSEQIYTSKKIIFAAGVNDLINNINIKNMNQFWGKAIFHCPYCHGYEVANRNTGIILVICRLKI